MLSDRPIGYVDLRSPAGIGLGALVYNYDGRVFASDEGRMLAETRSISRTPTFAAIDDELECSAPQRRLELFSEARKISLL